MKCKYLIQQITLSCILLSSITINSNIIAVPSSQSSLKALASFYIQLERDNVKLKMGIADIEASKARTRAAAQSFYNPELELDVERTGFNRNNIDTVVVGVNQTLDWYDKRSARKNVALLSQKVTHYEQEVASQNLRAEIFSALADYHMQRETISAHGKRLALFTQVLSQAKKLYKAGDISKLDFEQIRLSQTRAQLILSQEKTKLVSKEKSLGAISGVFRRTWPLLPNEPPSIDFQKINFNKLVDNSSVAKVKIAKIAEARSLMRLRVRQQKADPTIGLRAGGEDSEGIIGISLSIPLNVRNNFQAEVDESRVNIIRAERDLENSKHQLKAGLSSAAQTYKLVYKSWQSWRKIAGSSLKNQSNLLIRLWKAGELSTSDYLVQLNQIKEAEINNVELKGDVWKAWFNWLAKSNQFDKWLNGSLNNFK